MMSWKSRGLMLLAASAVQLLRLEGSASAGLKADENVSVNAGSAAGSVGTARSSSDAVQYIECTVQSFPSGSAVFCAARNKAGTFLSCTASANASNFATAVAAIGVGSRTYFAVSGGACTQIDVRNGSRDRPAVP